MSRRSLAVGLVVLLVASSPATVVAAGSAGHAASDRTEAAEPGTDTAGAGLDPGLDRRPETDAGAVEQPADEGLERTLTLRRRPDLPGEFETEVAFDVPDRVTSLEVTLGAGATVESANGFDRVGGDVYEWTGATRTPRIAFATPANETDRDHRRGSAPPPAPTTDPQDDDGRYFVDAGEWALVRVPSLDVRWSHTGDRLPTSRTVVVDGEGATGGDVAYLGPVTEHARDARGERVRLVVPEAADMRESPADVLDALERASERLRVDARNDEVVVVVAPTEGVRWAARGIQYGRADAWVVDDARLDVASNAWLHEYVHARQRFATSSVGTTPETRWLVEAGAEYRAALLSLEQGLIDYREFRRFLERGQEWPYDEGALAAPGTWRDPRTDYVKGPLVLAALDRRLRLETDGERTLEDVVRRLNLRDGRVTEAAFLGAVADRGGPDAAALAERYTRGDGAPTTWDRAAHAEAFDREVPAFEYGIDGASEVAVAGPYRTVTTVASDGVLPTVVPGETVTVPVTAANVGERAGEYEVSLVVDGRAVDAETGPLDPAGRTTAELSWTPATSGTYEVRVGGDRLSVRVASPATATVTDLSAAPERAEPGEAIEVRATVENEADRPAEETVRIRTPPGVAAEEAVRLGPGESATVETTVQFGEPAGYEIAAGDRTETVTVERAGIGGTSGAEDAVDGLPVSGFGPATALVALLALVAGLSARNRPRGR